MKTVKYLIVVCAIIMAAGCGGKGVETNTPQPLENASLKFATPDGQQYQLVTDASGSGAIQMLDDSGAVIEEAEVTVTLNSDGTFEATVQLSDSQTITVSASVATDGAIVNINVQINQINIIVNVTNNTSSSDGSVAPDTDVSSDAVSVCEVGISGTTLTFYNLGSCTNYTSNTMGASAYNEDVTCNGENHSLVFSNITYSGSTVIGYQVAIDGYVCGYGNLGGSSSGSGTTTTPSESATTGPDASTSTTTSTLTADGPVTVGDANDLVGLSWDGSNLWVLDSFYGEDCKLYKIDIGTGDTIGTPTSTTFWAGSGPGCDQLEWDGTKFRSVDTLDVPQVITEINADGSQGSKFTIEETYPDGMTIIGNSIFLFNTGSPAEMYQYDKDGIPWIVDSISGGSVLALSDAMTYCNGSFWVAEAPSTLYELNVDYQLIGEHTLEIAEDWPDFTDATCDRANNIIYLSASEYGYQPVIFSIDLNGSSS